MILVLQLCLSEYDFLIRIVIIWWERSQRHYLIQIDFFTFFVLFLFIFLFIFFQWSYTRKFESMTHKMQWEHVNIGIGWTCWRVPVDQFNYHIYTAYFLSKFMNPRHPFFLLLTPKKWIAIHLINFKLLLNVLFNVLQIYFEKNAFLWGVVDFVECDAGATGWRRVFNDWNL